MANHLDLEEQEQIDQLKHFWNTWGTLISVVVIVVCGAVAAWNGYKYWQNRQAVQAAVLAEEVESAERAGDKGRVEQAWSDLSGKYGSTVQAGQSGLAVAKFWSNAGNTDAAKAALTWVADKSSDDGLKALAKLRLSSLLMEQKAYDEALAQLGGSFPAEFEAVVADRKGDLLTLKGSSQDAIAEYQRAYKAFDPRTDYRRLVEIKLNALGATPQVVASAELTKEAK